MAEPDLIGRMINDCGFEELVIEKLLNIEGRISAVETSLHWFKFIARGGVIVIFGFFGLDLSGVI